MLLLQNLSCDWLAVHHVYYWKNVLMQEVLKCMAMWIDAKDEYLLGFILFGSWEYNRFMLGAYLELLEYLVDK